VPPYPLFDANRVPLLVSLFNDADFRLVDIGGRGEALSALMPLAPFSRYYTAEPDREEAERLAQELPRHGRWRDVTVMGEAIASTRGDADLHVTQQPGMSSLLEPDPAVVGRYYVASKFEVVKVVQVRTLPLDEAASVYDFSDAAFLKLDTQGTELDILRSGERLVDGPVMGVYTEASFHAFYKGQALFADIDAHLRQHGFELFSLSRTLLRRAGYMPSRYSTRVVAWAHCLYLREPETLLAFEGDTLRRRLSRLLALALTFEFYDMASELVAIAHRLTMLDATDLTRLRQEVAEIGRAGTRHMVRRAEKRGAEVLMSGSFRDKKQVE
jgi:FkbM family methyltransferase